MATWSRSRRRWPRFARRRSGSSTPCRWTHGAARPASRCGRGWRSPSSRAAHSRPGPFRRGPRPASKEIRVHEARGRVHEIGAQDRLLGRHRVADRPRHQGRRLPLRVEAGAARPRHQGDRLPGHRRADPRHARQREGGAGGGRHVDRQRGPGRGLPAQHGRLRGLQPRVQGILPGRPARPHHRRGRPASQGRQRRDRRGGVGAVGPRLAARTREQLFSSAGAPKWPRTAPDGGQPVWPPHSPSWRTAREVSADLPRGARRPAITGKRFASSPTSCRFVALRRLRGRRPSSVTDLQEDNTMADVTRRRFLGTASLAAAGAAMGPWVRRTSAQAGPVKIGLVLPYSGVYAVLGESITQGMELVFARENWTVAGRKIEMIKEDDEMQPPVGIRKTEKLIDSDKVDILTGPVHSGILMGMRDKVHNSKTILIVSNAGADAISRERCSKWIFRTSFSNWQPNHPMGEWVAKHVAKDVFIAAPNYQAGKDQLGAFKETFAPAGGKLVGEDYPKLGETDYAPYLTKIRQSGAKAVYAFFSGSDAVNFVKQYDQFGLKQSIKLTGAGFLTEPDVLPAQGKSALGVITGHFYTPLLDNPTNQRFVKEFQAKFGGKMPDGFACQGYDTAEVIVRALKAVNGNTQDKPKLVEVIEKSEFDSPRGRFRFDPKTHNVIQPFIYIREVKEVAGGLNNVPIDKVANVTDPGTGCTLPA